MSAARLILVSSNKRSNYNIGIIIMPKFKGKLIGAGIGAFMGGPIGALIGGMLGHYFKDIPEETVQRRTYSRRLYTQPGYGEFIFVSNLVALLTAMAKADGQVSREEVSVIRRYFQNNLGYQDEELLLIKNLIKESLKTQLDIEQICYQLRLSANYQSRLVLLELLYQVAYADQVIHPGEQTLLTHIAKLLGILGLDQRRIAAQYQIQDESRYYEILGVGKEADMKEIKRVYRRLVQQNHPDKVNHLGEEYVKIAHQQLTKINEAYDYVRRQKGF